MKHPQKSGYLTRIPTGGDSNKNSQSSLENRETENAQKKLDGSRLLTQSKSHKFLFSLRKSDSARPRSQNYLSADLDDQHTGPAKRVNKTSLKVFPLLDNNPNPQGGSMKVIKRTSESPKYSLEAIQGSEPNSQGILPTKSLKKLLFFGDGTTKLVDQKHTPKLNANTINNWDNVPKLEQKQSGKCLHHKAKDRLVNQMSKSMDRIVVSEKSGEEIQPGVPVGESKFKNQLNFGQTKKFDLIKNKDGTTKLKYKK